MCLQRPGGTKVSGFGFVLFCFSEEEEHRLG